MITQDRLKELFFYEPETGKFFVVKNRKGSSKKVGSVLGSKTKAGYVEADIDGKKYTLHRLAFLYMTGCFPDGFVDHKNRDKSDNSWNNLRVVTHQQNTENNIAPRKHGSLGCRGVHKYKNKYRAKIVSNSKQIHLGTFETMQEAANAYLVAKQQIHTFYEG